MEEASQESTDAAAAGLGWWVDGLAGWLGETIITRWTSGFRFRTSSKCIVVCSTAEIHSERVDEAGEHKF